MDKSNRYDKFLQLRDEFPFFAYEGYDYSYSGHGLDIRYYFNLSDKFHFSPTIFIPKKEFFIPEEEIMELLPTLVFHLGLIELISYWKAACPKQLIIKPHALSPDQVLWWKKCWFNGLGEFFFLNSISTDIEQFIDVKVASEEYLSPIRCALKPDVIVPVGGGKDSIVSLEILRKLPGVTPLILNPRGASVHSIFMAGFSHAGMIGISRSIDPLLLELNDSGFLNGHTPFSALLAFSCILSAVLAGKKYIALSNESSANESTIPGLPVNHQYSKTVEFEEDFRAYVKEWISPEIEYFSLLRPLNELQIAGIFTRYPIYFPVFKSCNVGSKTDSWCGKCPKCLFTCIMLSPFLNPDQLVEIFHRDLLNDTGLKPTLDQLTGITPDKPFECVGTLDEVNAALQETIKQYGDQPLPALLHDYAGLNPSVIARPGPRETKQPAMPPAPVLGNSTFNDLLNAWNPFNFLPPKFEALLKGVLRG
ncbi:MAG: hypothetical protein IH596_09520 [Bacteroidales bacterium]|nr:hypothetical protein [Bacteroidales bacterium]